MRKLLAFVAFSLFLSLSVIAQTGRTVTGKVTNEKGVPMSGVSVSVVGFGRNAITDQNGAFSINAPEKAKTLRFSFVGYEDVDQSIGSGPLSITLKEENKALNEVVVVGYGTQKKKEATGSLASVKGDAIANKPVQSFEQALGGRAAGVQITIPSGVLNAPPVIRIRGTNSISLSSYPLIVIDGIPTFTGDASSTAAAGNALASINPNDIESIDVAKDAAATAIYGSRAANGVVFVTTKKGKAGKAKVTYDGWFGISQVQRLPQLLDAFQYTDFKNKALVNAGTFNANTNAFALTNGPDGRPINTNWYDFVYRTGIQHSHTVNVSGANDATSYYFSAGITKQQGIIRRNDFNRMSLMMNVDHKISKILSIGGKIQYSKEDNLAAVSSGSLGDAFATAGLGRVPLITAPNVSPYNNDGTYNISGALIGSQNNKQGQVGFNNPVVQLDLNRQNSYAYRLLSNVYVQAKPFSWMTLRSTYSIDNLNVDNDSYFSPLSGEGFSTNGSATANFNKNERWVWTNTMQLDKTFADKHNVSLLIGNEQQKTNSNGYGINRIGVNDPNFTVIQAGWQTPNTAGLGIGENYLISDFSRLQYNYDRKYYLSGNIRRDGASQLGSNNKYGTFWGVSAGWEIAREAFWSSMRMDKVFSSFKLRASYGKVGNIGGLGNFTSLSTFGSGLYGGNGTVVYNQAGNADLTWETSRKTDIGINFGILNDRITAEVAYYKNDIDGLLLFVPQPPSAGLPSTIPRNVGKMYNEGIEFSVDAAVVNKKNFTWRTSFNAAYNDNKVTSLAPGLNNIISSTGGLENPSITLPGYPIGMLFVTRSAGVDPATGRRIYINGAGRQVFYQRVPPPGQFQWSYADGTAAPTVSSADAVVYRNTNPRWTGGWDNNFRYRNFELNILMTYQFGSWIYFGTNAGLRDQRFWNNSVDVLRAWTKPGDVTDVPKSVFGDNVSNGSAFPMDVNVFKGDFVKMRTLGISYYLPKSILDKVKISSARFYINGNNLLIITPYPGPDPEVSSNGNGSSNFGIDRNTVANQRTITFGLNVGF